MGLRPAPGRGIPSAVAASSGGGSVPGLYSCVAPVAMAVRYLYINVHSAASVPCCALPWDCEEMSKKIGFVGVVIWLPNRNL